MSNRYTRLFQHLLPRSIAWRIVIDKKLKQFFDGLSIIQEGIIDHLDYIFDQSNPEKTDNIVPWLEQFNLKNRGSLANRRKNLAAAWITRAYQSPKVLQDTLQAAGFDLYVHEWWELPVVSSPVVRNPFLYINDGHINYICSARRVSMVCGNEEAVSGAYLDAPDGLLLVNKTDSGVTYNLPNTDANWPYFIYIGGETFGDFVNISNSRKNELETLLLKIRPAEQWIGLFVTYT